MDELETRIREMIGNRKECETCPLSDRQVVIYEKMYDDGDCDVLFFGINPGKDEAKQNRPFIGRSGKVLRGKLEEFEIAGEFNVAFTNAILCSTPNEKEIPDVELCIKNCRDLVREISKELKPRLYVPVGQNCSKFLFKIEGRITAISGELFKNNIMPIVHPAALVYNRNGPAGPIFNRSMLKIKEFLKNDN